MQKLVVVPVDTVPADTVPVVVFVVVIVHVVIFYTYDSSVHEINICLNVTKSKPASDTAWYSCRSIIHPVGTSYMDNNAEHL